LRFLQSNADAALAQVQQMRALTLSWIEIKRSE